MSSSVRPLRSRSLVRLKSRRGVTAVLFAVSLVVIVGLVAFAVDCGFMNVMKTEQQSSADASALAGASVLYKDGNLNVSNALEVARDYYERNTGRPAIADKVEFAVGRWDSDLRQFVSDETSPDSVQVLSRSSELPTFFGRMFQTDSFKVRYRLPHWLSSNTTSRYWRSV